MTTIVVGSTVLIEGNSNGNISVVCYWEGPRAIVTYNSTVTTAHRDSSESITMDLFTATVTTTTAVTITALETGSGELFCIDNSTCEVKHNQSESTSIFLNVISKFSS